MKIWEGKFDKILQEIENDFPRGWHPKGVRTFVERVDNDVGWAVIGQSKCLLEALYQYVIRGLVSAVAMSHVNAMEYIAGKIGTIRKLGKEGKYQVPAILFIGIPEVEVIVSHGGQSSIAQFHDFLDDRRADR